jgi:TonB-linked SusC/RagA family outer membrane protein
MFETLIIFTLKFMRKLNHLPRTVFLKVCLGKTFRKLQVVIVLLLVTVFNVFGVNTFSNFTNPNSGKKNDLIASMQQGQVTGKVIDEQGNTMPGVNVQVDGTTIGAITDKNGNYSIDKPGNNAVLVFSFIGYITQRISVVGKTEINVKLAPSVAALEEVVVTGYTTQIKKDITGSVAVLDISNLKENVSHSAEQSLQGLVSGVNVISSGIPDAESKILIRGVTSFGDTQPLVIVDGIEQSLNNISSNDIESIQVLKDAGSASIYGVRGANGVIVVTTKKGKAGAPVFSYEGYWGMQYPKSGNPGNMLSSENFMKVFNMANPGNELFKNGMPDYTYRGPAGTGAVMAGDPAVDPSLYFYKSKNTGENYIIQNVNKTNDGGFWFRNTFKNAPTMSHSFTASGGSDKANYLFSLGYLNQQGTAVGSYLKRYSARINTAYTFNKWLKVGENANIIYKDVPLVNESTLMNAASEMNPLVPLKDIMGNWGGTFGGPDLGGVSNPVAIAIRNTQKSFNYQWFIIGNTYAEVTPLKGLTARTSIGYNINNMYSQYFTPPETENINGNSDNNNLSISSGYGSTMTFTNTLNYDNLFGKNDVKVLLGSEAIRYNTRYNSGGSQNFFSEDFNYLTLGNGTSNLTNSSSISENKLFSLFGRVDYSFDSRYLMAITLRRDGSSMFGANKRYGVFPSVSIGWRVSKESFMENLTWLNDLKVRGSYGILGSQNNVSANNSFFLFNSSLGNTYYDINGTGNSVVQGFAQSQIGNLNTKWEEDIITNFGFDATILNNSLTFSVEYYEKVIKGLLFPQPLPAVILGNATAPTVNTGDIQNTGVDASVMYRGNITHDFHFNAGLNLTTYKNEVKNIPDPGYFYAGSVQYMPDICRNEEGYPVSSFYGYKIIGLFNSAAEVAAAPTQTAAAPGRFRYQDTNGDGVITDADRVHLGSPNPAFTYGITLGLDYKGFDFSAIFYGSQGNKIWNGTRRHDFVNDDYNKSNAVLNAWTPENTNTTIPIIETVSTFSTNLVPNSFYVEDGSYLRLKSLMLGYTVKPSILQKLGISNLRVYAQALNLFTITKYSGLDPELGGPSASFGIDDGTYPAAELGLLIGLNITF